MYNLTKSQKRKLQKLTELSLDELDRLNDKILKKANKLEKRNQPKKALELLRKSKEIIIEIVYRAVNDYELAEAIIHQDENMRRFAELEEQYG